MDAKLKSVIFLLSTIKIAAYNYKILSFVSLAIQHVPINSSFTGFKTILITTETESS